MQTKETIVNEMSDSKTILSPRSQPKRKFTEEDDQKLLCIIKKLGTKSWANIANEMGDRNPRQCKERWTNYLSPDINKMPWTEEEDKKLIELQKKIGSRWILMREYFDHRTDAALKNRWQMLDRRSKKRQRQLNNSKKVEKRPVVMLSTIEDKPILMQNVENRYFPLETYEEEQANCGAVEFFNDFSFEEDLFSYPYLF